MVISATGVLQQGGGHARWGRLIHTGRWPAGAALYRRSVQSAGVEPDRAVGRAGRAAGRRASCVPATPLVRRRHIDLMRVVRGSCRG